MLRDKLLVMLGPAASRLIIDLSAIQRYADASGLAVLAGHRAARWAARRDSCAWPRRRQQAADALSITGLDRHLAIFPRSNAGTSQAALTKAARALLFVLTQHRLTHSPAVAATASRLRVFLDPDRRPAHT